MIRRVRLRNWKSHENTEIDFSRGTNVIVGIMGSGKTSILQAIGFALFGELPELRKRRIKLSDLIMRKPVRKSRAEVMVEFEKNGVIYQVFRSIEANASDAKLLREGRLFEVGAKRVTSKVEEILGIDYETFARVIYGRQNELDEFLRLGKGERVKIIDELLRIDKIEDARKKVLEIARELRGRVFELESFVSGFDFAEAESEVKRLQEEIEGLRKEIKVLRQEEERLKAELKEVEGELLKLREAKRKKEELERRKAEIRGRIASLIRNLQTLPFVENAEEKFKEVNRKLQELRELEAKLRKEIASKKALANEARKKVAQIEVLKKIVEEIVEDHRPELEKVGAEILSIENKIRELEKAVDELSKAEAFCPVCGAPLRNKEELIRHRKDEIETLEAKLLELRKRKFELEKLVKEEEYKRRRQELAKAKLEEALEAKDKLKLYETSALELELKKIVDEIEKLEKTKDYLRDAIRRRELEKQLEVLRKSLEELESIKIEVNEQEMQELEQRRIELNSKLGEILGKLRNLPVLIEEKERRREKLLNDLARFEKAKNELKKMKKAVENATKLVNLLRELQIIVRSAFVEAVNEILGDVWSILYPYGDYSGLALFVETDGAREGDYVLKVKEGSRWVPVDGLTSGGERSIAALALRIAFARVLSSWGVLFLDEPTHNLDERGIDELAEVLRDRVSETMEQVIVITHEERLEKAATGKAWRIERNKDANEPSRAVEVG